MKLLDVMTSPWAIEPEKLIEIRNIYETHLRGDKIDLAGVEARLGHSLDNKHENFDVIDGVAVIPVHGVIAKRMNLFSKISGGASTQLLQRDIHEAMNDEKVNQIILDIDSPGGTVDGTAELTDFIFNNVRGEKPIYAHTDGLMASAAYWIGSAADGVYISGPTSMVGSIGVVSTHVDVSKMEKNIGIKTTEITAGKYKRIASQYEPLSKEGRESIQADVDYLYSIFVETVARNRGVDIEQVLSDMADGRVFIGQQALNAGLVDGVSTLDQLIHDVSHGNLVGVRQEAGVADVTAPLEINTTQKESVMSEKDTQPAVEITKGYILDNHPDIAEAIRNEGFDDGMEKGAAAECKRIQSVHEQSMPGHEALIEECMFDGKTSGPEAAVKVLNAEKEKRGRIASDISDDAPKPLESAPDNSVSTATSVENENAPIEERAKATWDSDVNIRNEFGEFDSYLHYRKAEETGNIRVLRK